LYDYACDQIAMHTSKQTPGKWSYKTHGEIVMRQFTRLEQIPQTMLPDELTNAIEDTRPFVREGSVKELEKLLRVKNLGLARAAREMLEKMAAEDDSLTVQRAAANVLRDAGPTVGQNPKPEVPVQPSPHPQPHTGNGEKPQANIFQQFPALFKNKRIIISIATVLFLYIMIFVIIPAGSKSDISSTPVVSGISNLYVPSFGAGEDIYAYFNPDQLYIDQKFEARWFLKLNVLWIEYYVPIGHDFYTANRVENVYFQLKNPGLVGEYRVDIYRDQELLGTQTFKILPRE
jgi:hypothetical protein